MFLEWYVFFFIIIGLLFFMLNVIIKLELLCKLLMVNWFVWRVFICIFFVDEIRYLFDNLCVGIIKVVLFVDGLYELNDVILDNFEVLIMIVLYLVINLW